MKIQLTIIRGRAIENHIGIFDQTIASVLLEAKHSELPWYDPRLLLNGCLL